MKSQLKCLTLLLGMIGFAAATFAQQAAKPEKEKVAESYSRLSVTFFMGSLPDAGAPANAAGKIKFSDKYFNHNLKNLGLPLGQDFKLLSFDKKRDYLREWLTREGVGRKMVGKWFNRQENGAMNLDYVHQCGLYNANDQDVKMSGAAKRGDAFLKDAGQNLINKTYVLILVPNEVKSKDDGKTRGWDCQYDLFFYQLVFTPDVVAKFYDVWPYDDDDAAVKQKKAAAFDTLTFKFTDVQSRAYLSSSVSETFTNNKHPKSLDQLMEELVNRMYESATFSLDKTLEDFRVKVKVSRVHPVRAKVGKKEGLKCDQQFFVYQYKMNEATGTVAPERQAVVRATNKIVDNRMVATGSSPESSFYQTYGGTIQEGMILQQRLDFGLSALLGYESGNIGGMDLNFMFRTGPFTKVTGLYLMIDLGLDKKNYAPAWNLPIADYTFLRYSIGLGKGLRMGRIVELTPYVQYGIEQTTTKVDSYKDLQTSFIKTGGMVGINLMHNCYLIGQLNYYLPFGDISVKDKSGTKSTWKGVSWDKEFKDRTGSAFMIGVRYEF